MQIKIPLCINIRQNVNFLNILLENCRLISDILNNYITFALYLEDCSIPNYTFFNI